MPKYEKNHTVSKGTNKHWCGETNELKVFDGQTIHIKGLNVWSVVKKIYSKETEERLGKEIETYVIPIHDRIIKNLSNNNPIDFSVKDKLLMADNICAQIYRTKMFIDISNYIGIDQKSSCSTHLIGCECCIDYKILSEKTWYFIVSDSDIFVKNDNALSYIGFGDDGYRKIVYPLSPKITLVVSDSGSERQELSFDIIKVKSSDPICNIINSISLLTAYETCILPTHFSNDMEILESLSIEPQVPYALHDGMLNNGISNREELKQSAINARNNFYQRDIEHIGVPLLFGTLTELVDEYYENI